MGASQEPRIVNLQSGRIAAVTPYQPGAIERFKALMGKWQLVTGIGHAWTFAAEHRPAVAAILAEYWPPAEAKVERIYTFTGTGAYGSPRIDGRDLVRFERDWTGRPLHDDVVEILENTLRSGGSRRNPTLSGRLVVRARVRPAAEARWPGGTVETTEATPAPEEPAGEGREPRATTLAAV